MTEIQQAFYELAEHLVSPDPTSEGTIQYSGRRFVYLHTKMFSRLFEKMEEMADDDVEERLDMIGVKAGYNIAENMDRHFKENTALDKLKLIADSGFDLGNVLKLKDSDPRSQIEKIFGYGKHVGWLGNVDVLEYEEGEFAKYRYDNGFDAYSHGETGEKNCRFISGVINGMTIFFWDTGAVETDHVKCVCAGDDKCVTEVRVDG